MLTFKILLKAFVKYALLFGAYALVFAVMVSPLPPSAVFVLIGGVMWLASMWLDGRGW